MEQSATDHAVAVLRALADDLETGRLTLQEWAQRFGPLGMVTVAYSRNATAPPRGNRPCACTAKPVDQSDGETPEGVRELRCPDCGATWTEDAR